jgi:nicotinamidase-related amidase
VRDQGREEALRYRFDRIEDMVVPNIQKLLRFFREHGLTVIYLTIGSRDPDFRDLSPVLRPSAQALGNREGTIEQSILEALSPESGELVINKTSIGAFNSSHLDLVLRNLATQFLFFAGVATDVCVDLTARDAADRGYGCVIVEDACAAHKETYHNAALTTFHRVFGEVWSTDMTQARLSRKL